MTDTKLAVEMIKRRREQVQQAVTFGQHDIEQMQKRIQARHEVVQAAQDELDSIVRLLIQIGEVP